MKIAVLSDTHKKVDLMRDILDFIQDKDIDYIIHAGDLEIVENLELLEDSGIEYISVFGNNDSMLYNYQKDYNIYKEPYYFKIKKIKFKLMHLPFYLSNDADIIIFGHTHQFEYKYQNKTLFLNPGEVCARNKPLSEFVILDIGKSYKITHYFKDINKQGDYEFEIYNL